MDLNVQQNIPLQDYTTLKIGGPAKFLVAVSSVDELKAALRFASEETTQPPLILGGGSNLLCSDEGFDGLVIVNQLHGYEVSEDSADSVLVTVGAGEVFDEIVERTVAEGYWGLENLSAIPGSVGATPIQNVGAYGVEVESLIEAVTAVHRDTLEEKTFSPEECQFSYRDSFFKSPAGKVWCVTSVTYRLSTQPKPVLTYQDLLPVAEEAKIDQSTVRKTVIAIRSKKFPDWHTVGTAGSFFKNPIISNQHYQKLLLDYPELPGFPVGTESTKVPLGWILDKACGLRGHAEGPVRLYEAQALVLVAEKGATAQAVEAFVSDIRMRVHETTGINIEREVLSV